jgi:hypothetical protein
MGTLIYRTNNTRCGRLVVGAYIHKYQPVMVREGDSPRWRACWDLIAKFYMLQRMKAERGLLRRIILGQLGIDSH